MPDSIWDHFCQKVGLQKGSKIGLFWGPEFGPNRSFSDIWPMDLGGRGRGVGGRLSEVPDLRSPRTRPPTRPKDPRPPERRGT